MSLTHYNRRRFLRDALAIGAASGLPAYGAGGRLRFMALGQAAIQYDLRQQPYAQYAALAALLKQADICFTDLETAVAEPGALTATNQTQFLKAAPPAVLDCLADLSVNVLALSNNHSWDLGAAGILTTLDAVRARGFAYAGTGANLNEAAAPGYRESRAGRIALVAMASGAIRDGAAATANRAGVNEARLAGGGAIDPADATRILGAISDAARNAAYVFCYQHNHYWEKDFRVTPEWQRTWARRCMDAGAHAYISHGAPLLQGVEIYRGRPIFYDLGNFVFHSRTAAGYYPPEVWESVIADCIFDAGRLVSLELTPVMLNEHGVIPERFHETRGRPVIAQGEDANRILNRLRDLSSDGGVTIKISGATGHVAI